MVARDGDGDFQYDILRLGAEAVDMVGEAVSAVGDLRDLRPRQALGVVVQMLGVAADGVDAVALEQLSEFAFAGDAGGELRLQVAEHRGPRHAAVGRHQAHDLLVETSLAVQVNRRDHQALLIDLGGVGARKAGLAAEVDQVHAHRGESEQLATVVGGLDDAHVLRVLRAAIRIVDQKDIVGAHVLDPAHVLDHRPNRVGQVA